MLTPSTPQEIGLRIRHRRMERHLDQCALARLLGWRDYQVNRLECGRWVLLQPAMLCALALGLGVSTDYLLGMEVES